MEPTIELSHSSKSFDSVIGDIIDNNTAPEITSEKTISIKANVIKSLASILSISETEVTFRPNKTISARKILATIRSNNPELDIQYSEDLEDNELIHKSEKPLWILNQSSNGVFKLQKAL